MKLKLILLCLAICNVIYSQAPEGFNYQASVRNQEGLLLTNQNVSFMFNLMQGNPNATVVYSETHQIITDDQGTVDLVIGQGTIENGMAFFNEIDWSLAPYFIEIELDTGNGFVSLGTLELLSVPYALYAETAGFANVDMVDVLNNGNSANFKQIKNLGDPTEATDAVNKAYVDNLSFENTTLQNFNGWDNYQVWQDNTTYTLTSNSFVFINADNCTLIFPDGPENCCFGDVIYIYMMDNGKPPLKWVNLQANGYPISISNGQELKTTQNSFSGKFSTGGMHTIINVGNQWMVANFHEVNDDIPNTGETTTYGSNTWTDYNTGITTYRDGTAIPHVQDQTIWKELKTGAWCYYDNYRNDDPNYGKLYNWYAVMGIHDEASLNDPSLRKEFAPEGFKVPNVAEWEALYSYLIASGYNYDGTNNSNKIAKALAAKELWQSSEIIGSPGNSPETNNESTFNAIPVGVRGGCCFTDYFYSRGIGTYFWTSNEHDEIHGVATHIHYDMVRSSYQNNFKTDGYSVRFIEDQN